SISASFSLLFHMYPPPPRSTLFPYTTLFRSDRVIADLRTRIGGMSTKLRLVRPLDYYTEFVASQTMTGNQLLFMPKWELLALLRSEEHTSELQSRVDLVCRLLLEKKKSVVSC